MGTRSGACDVIAETERRRFVEEGFVYHVGVLTEEVVAFDPVHDAVMRGEIEVVGRDLDDDTELRPDDELRHVPTRRSDITVDKEGVRYGSGEVAP